MPPALSNLISIIGQAFPAGAIGGAITGYYSARLAEHARRGDRLREDHFDELKREFLSVLLARIDHYYAPIAANKSNAVALVVFRVNRPEASIAESSHLRTEHQLCIVPIRNIEGGFPLAPQTTARLHSGSFDRLFEDARTRHYQKLVEAWLSLESDFEKAAQVHLDHTENVKRELIARLKLPPGDGMGSSPRVKYDNLSLFVYEHQLGTHPYHLWIYPEGSLEVSSSSSQTPYVWSATAQGAKDALAAINEVAERSKKESSFLSAFEPLRPRIEEIRSQIEASIHDMKLPAKCQYC